MQQTTQPDRASEAPAKAPVVIADVYDVLEVLGEGSVARTLLAVERASGRRVAIKAMVPARNATMGDFVRFEREAEALRQLDHPAIPKYIDDFVSTDGVFCLVQTYVEGAPLPDGIARGVYRDRVALVSLGIDLLRVLLHLEQRTPPVVHRDIKPNNIIVSSAGVVHLVDFGGVREAVRQTIRAGSTVIGTYGFMPPEQLIGDATPASDIFAVGVTMICAWTQQEAHALSDDGFSIPPHRMGLEADDPLRAVLVSMTATRIEDRYRTAHEVIEDLQGILEGRRPIFCDRLRAETERRKREEKRESNRRLRKGVTVLFTTFVAVTTGVFLYALGGLAYMAYQGGLGGAHLALPLISVAAVGIGFALTARRYLDLAWVPPGRNWLTARGYVMGLDTADAYERREQFSEKLSRGEVLLGGGVVGGTGIEFRDHRNRAIITSVATHKTTRDDRRVRWPMAGAFHAIRYNPSNPLECEVEAEPLTTQDERVGVEALVRERVAAGQRGGDPGAASPAGVAVETKDAQVAAHTRGGRG